MTEQSRYLYLMRHGDAEYKARVTDFQRALSPFGKKQIKMQVEQFKTEEGIRPDCIFCSTARRTRETAEEFKKLFKGVPVFYRETLYLAPPHRLLELIRETDDLFARILIIGHNPGLEQLAGMLNEKAICIPFKTADCVVIRMNVSTWAGVKPKVGKIEKIFLSTV